MEVQQFVRDTRASPETSHLLIPFRAKAGEVGRKVRPGRFREPTGLVEDVHVIRNHMRNEVLRLNVASRVLFQARPLFGSNEEVLDQPE